MPTMGALHPGHLSLIEESKKKCDLTVVSIFVNPTQFSNSEDLLKYPKPIQEDCLLLETVGCDVLFNPSEQEIYKAQEKWEYEVGPLNKVLEGASRPGHYEGVTQIVYKLFTLVKPDVAFFGQKDYQQFLVITAMAKHFEFDIDLEACPIIREPDGLAMSSRNIRLNTEEREAALQLHKALVFIKNNYQNIPNNELLTEAKGFFRLPLLKLAYLEIVNREDLQATKENEVKAIALVACTVGETRLIDNMMLP